MNNTDTLKERIETIKRNATRMFHNDHSDGDLAIYQAIDDMTDLLAQHTAVVERRADYLNDALIRAANFMLENKLLPPDTTTRDGIRSYFLNEARFKEAKQFNKEKEPES